jgi:hypothetical protein
MKVGDIGVIDIPVELHEDIGPGVIAELNGTFCLIVKEEPVQDVDMDCFSFKMVKDEYCYVLAGGTLRNVWKSFILPCDMESPNDPA